eukprot:scaffold1794_cov390-Prasinococcus_capsulatus_cf.AAC.4
MMLVGALSSDNDRLRSNQSHATPASPVSPGHQMTHTLSSTARKVARRGPFRGELGGFCPRPCSRRLRSAPGAYGAWARESPSRAARARRQHSDPTGEAAPWDSASDRADGAHE